MQIVQYIFHVYVFIIIMFTGMFIILHARPTLLCSLNGAVNSLIRDVVRRQANPSFLKKGEYRDGIKRKGGKIGTPKDMMMQLYTMCC